MTHEPSTTGSRESQVRSDPPEAPKARAAAWLSRLAGLAMLGEQSASHALGKGSDLMLLGVGLFLLAGKEGIEFMRVLLGRSDS